ncbi:hypothetical protein FA95DRAFT_615104 [Auriscalpium vulgare]|uniref:Uncharacterized protein n=1 Tax=Auriscalpium vulgare TaxID=40419 RepID=A0ACB8RDE7_9AGAM|nr:hypothetical protein FA95DRAFT_615104 [Auriscalpium vulgare]
MATPVLIILHLDSYRYMPRRSPVDWECARWLRHSLSLISIRTVTCLEGRLRTGSVRDCIYAVLHLNPCFSVYAEILMYESATHQTVTVSLLVSRPP